MAAVFGGSAWEWGLVVTAGAADGGMGGMIAGSSTGSRLRRGKERRG